MHKMSENITGMEGDLLAKGVIRKIRLKGFITGLIPVIIMAGVLFLSSGQVTWPMAWIFIGIHTVATAILVMSISPSLILERSYRKDGVKTWDVTLVRLLHGLGILLLITAGIDLRFHLTGYFPISLQVFGLILFILGYGILILAAISNPFFSALVRIQDEREHHVICNGLYQYIRHPGYLGLILCMVAEPLMFHSLPAWIPCILVVALFFIRTGFEDRTLIHELSGYSGYANRVKYRIIPWIW